MGKQTTFFIKTKFAIPWYMQKSKRVSIVPSTQGKKTGENIHTANEPRVQPNPQTWDVSDLLQETGESFNSPSALAGVVFNWKQLPSPHPAPRMTHYLPPRPSVLQNILHHHGNSQTSAFTWVWLDWILLPFFFFGICLTSYRFKIIITGRGHLVQESCHHSSARSKKKRRRPNTTQLIK